MNLKIIVGLSVADHCVEKDGVAFSFDLTGMVAPNIWAISWAGSIGEVEYNDGTFNENITELPDLTQVLAKFDELKAAKDAQDAIDNAPVPERDRQIAELEAQITQRNLRAAALGDQYAIDHLQSIEDQIRALR